MFSSCVPEVLIPPNKYQGCCETSPLELTIDDGTIFVPNAISPNDDGINDEFTMFSSKPVKIVKMHIEEQNKVLEINQFNIPVFEETELWSPINISGVPIHGLFKYSLEVSDLKGDTLLLEGQFCSIDCTDSKTKTIKFPSCIFTSISNGSGQIDTSKLIIENDCSF